MGCHPVAVVQYIFTQTIHRTTQITTNVEECGPCPVFASFTLAFGLTTVEKARKNHSQGKKNLWLRNTSKYSIHITKTTQLYKTHTTTHITTSPPTHTHTHTHTHTLQNNIKPPQYKLKQTVQDTPKWNSHKIIKYPQCKVTLMYIAPLSTRTSP
jgi:predicted dehydrogenase